MGRPWIPETYMPGTLTGRLSAAQLRNLGALLAAVHKTESGAIGVDIWDRFLDENKLFGNEQTLLQHSDPRLRRLITRARGYFKDFQPQLDKVPQSLVHGDATTGNTLVDRDAVSLIDWELSSFKDPMADFATIYYEDMEHNKGKWRIHISPDERTALFEGYESGGGVIDEDRIRVWMNFDKLGSAIYLHWRVHEPDRPATPQQIAQYQFDLKNLLKSLEENLQEL